MQDRKPCWQKPHQPARQNACTPLGETTDASRVTQLAEIEGLAPTLNLGLRRTPLNRTPLNVSPAHCREEGISERGFVKRKAIYCSRRSASDAHDLLVRCCRSDDVNRRRLRRDLPS